MGLFKLFKKNKETESKTYEIQNEEDEIKAEASAEENAEQPETTDQEEAKTIIAETPQPVEQEPQPYETPDEHDEERYLARAKELSEAEELFVLLSVSKANMIEGFSFPYVGNLGEGKLTLYLFSDYKLAQQFVLGSDYDVLDGIYPIGKLEKNDQFSTLINTLIIAQKIMGVSYFDIDGVANYSIAWFLENIGVKEYQVKIHLTNKETEEAKASKGQKPPKLPKRFNPIQISNFTNRFFFPEERQKELCSTIFTKEGETREDCLNTYMTKQSLPENCFLLTVLFLNYMPQAKKANQENDLKYFENIRHLLSMVIWMKLKSEKHLYTLVNPSTKEPILHNNSMCVLYTDRFKYIQGDCEYMPLQGCEAIKQYIAKYNLNAVVVDGITTTAVLDAAVCI